jgi:hypothetical protein
MAIINADALQIQYSAATTGGPDFSVTAVDVAGNVLAATQSPVSDNLAEELLVKLICALRHGWPQVSINANGQVIVPDPSFNTKYNVDCA